MKDIRIAVKKITPDLAESYLSEHKNYRNPNKSRVQTYIRMMRNEQWKLSIIIFDEDGKLIDGQHRLIAVIDSGLPQYFAVVTGYPCNSEVTLDNGQVRSRAQVLKAERGVKNGTARASMAGALEFGVTSTSYGKYSNLESVVLHDKYKDIIDSCFEAAGKDRRTAILLIPFARAIKRYPELKDKILKGLKCCVEMDFAEPASKSLKLFYQWYTMINRQGGSDVRTKIYMKGARALEAYLNDEVLSVVKAPKVDPFEERKTA